MAQVNEKPRKRQFVLELDEDEIAELITWATESGEDHAEFVMGKTGQALLQTLRRALSGPTRKSEGDNTSAPAKRSQTLSASPETGLDRQRGSTIDVGEGQQWIARD